MALSDFVLPRAELALPGGSSFSLRGLCFADITRLLTTAESDVEQAIELFQAGDTEDPAHQQAIISMILSKLPTLAAKVIACAADEPDAWKQASILPLPVQTEALTVVADLTFTEPDSLKKFVGHVTALVQRMAAAKK